MSDAKLHPSPNVAVLLGWLNWEGWNLAHVDEMRNA
jgi:hypothetical protein